MSSTIKRIVRMIIGVQPKERLKLLLLTISFALVIAAYTVAKDLKDSVFVTIVGREYIPLAKLFSMFVLIPAILFYSQLVDRIRRYQLLCFYSLLFAVLGFIFAYLIGHPIVGMNNTDSSPYRFFGWIFYFFVEGYSPFVVSVFWAFANSINDPQEAKENYGLMVSGSKLGGILSSGIAWYILTLAPGTDYFALSDTGKHQALLYLASTFLLVVPFVIVYMMKRVAGRYLHGYEAVYQLEKERGKKGEGVSGMFTGFFMLIKYPYVFGIFCMIFFYEMINTVLSYQRVAIAQETALTTAHMSGFLFKLTFATHLAGLFISLLGTRTLMRRWGEKLCLLFIPISSGILLLYFMISYTQMAFLLLFVAMRSINYAFSYPVRESLYIPTVKEMKFKSKSWIDAFGSKFAKTSGSAFNRFAEYCGYAYHFMAHSLFFAGVVACWLVAAFLLGRRFEQAVQANEVIGANDV